MAINKHKHGTTTEWSTVGYFGREVCAGCGFCAIGENRILTLQNSSRALLLCDGCVNAIGERADGEVHYTDGSVHPYAS
jgi:hypothetical protein